MKKRDIHTGKEVLAGESNYSKKISSDEMQEYIFESIDFPLSIDQWRLIDSSFAEFWNNKVGIGGYFYHDEIAPFIFERIVESKCLIPREWIEVIVRLMLLKIEQDGGFME